MVRLVQYKQTELDLQVTTHLLLTEARDQVINPEEATAQVDKVVQEDLEGHLAQMLVETGLLL